MKKGILVASFGTSFPEVRKRCIESIETAIEKAYPDFDVRRAFTSNMIIKKLKDRDGLHIDTPIEALDRMINDGITEIHVQPLHVISGFEYEKVKRAVVLANHKKGVYVTIGKPLLSEEHHYDEMIDAISNRLGSEQEDTGIVLMGHGTEHHANACYSMLQAKFNDRRSDVHIANVEGYPELEHIEGKLDKYHKMILMPLMIVAGDHAMNDMAGDEEDSYKSVLTEAGKSVECILEGLGEMTMIQEIFVKRVGEGLK
jgi:sirohydrochlorin cobaltochelatase